MTYVYISLVYPAGADMINKLLIRKEGNEEAIESLIKAFASIDGNYKKLNDKNLINYKERLNYFEIPIDTCVNFYQNPLFKVVFHGMGTDSFRFLVLDGVLKTITSDNIEKQLVDLKYPEWKNVCSNVIRLLDM